MLLVRPRAACGLSGAAELAAFAELAPMPAATTDRLCRIVLLELLPAILEGDGPRCGEALYAFGYAVGEYFAPAQHGIYADPRMARLVEHLRQSGIRGVGQSSWGPTLFVLCPDETQAASLIADLAKTEWSDCEYTIAAPLNTGAALECG
jgi:predicted sugar kinase